MRAPQIIMIIIISISVISKAIRSGETGDKSLIFGLIDAVVIIGLLLWGGFF